MVTGVLAVPEGTFQGESQYTVAGTADHMSVDLHIHESTRIDRTQEMRGSSLGQAIVLPIWRV